MREEEEAKGASTGFASMSAQVPSQLQACINPWQGAAPMNVLDTDAPDHLLVAIMEDVDPYQIADTLLQNVQT
jgi:hypothetical protein